MEHTTPIIIQNELYLRLIVAMLLGMSIGIERIIAHKTAGIRTHTLIAVGAALFTIISQLISGMHPNASYNAVYIPAAIITGVGFLEAGLLMWKGNHLTGLTSAVGLWICAGIGIACGYGFFKIAIFATLLVLFVFVVLWFIEQKIKKIALEIEKDIKN